MASQGTTPEEIAADNAAYKKWSDSFGGDYIGKKKKAAWWDQYNQKYRDRRASDVLAGKSSGKILSGTTKEQEGQLAGLNLAALGYGQGLGQTGQDIQRLKSQFQQRSAQGAADPVSAAIMGQKQSALAGASRSLQASGAKGAAAAGALDAIGRQRDADIAASLYGQQRQSLQDERSLVSNILSGTVGLMQGEKAANVTQPKQQVDSGTSFICTMLRSKGLMSLKESLIMTKFMLKSLVTRADFLVWYFEHGKKAVDAAEASGFDWSEIKKEFVDDIIDLLKEGKFTEAQNLYVGRTGDFCTHFGAKGFEEKLATKRFVAMFNFPRLFFIDNCNKWLKANFFNIPRILKISI